MKRNSESEKQICSDNISKCFIFLALIWSLCVLILLGWGLWFEIHNDHFTAAVDRSVHFWRWSISLGIIWLLALIVFWMGFRSAATQRRALQQVSTELACNEQENVQRKAICEAIYNSITDAIVFADKRMRIVMTNPAFTALTGYTPDEVKGRMADFFFSYLDIPPGNRTGSNKTFKEAECRLKNGSILPAEALGLDVRDGNSEIIGYIMVFRDLTRHKAEEKEYEILEAKLRQTCKTEAIGTLAGGIAHDFNNILGIILVNTDLAMEDIPEGNPARTNIDRIVQASERARHLVKQILAYSHHSDQKLVPLMPGPFVKESLKFLCSTTPANVIVTQNVNDYFRAIMMDPAQLRELLLNLYSNALQALHGRGEIEITGTVVHVDGSEDQNQPDFQKGHYFRLSVSDTGEGMDKETLERIFDPFYTTRDVGNGVGMGLASVLGVVRSHGGQVTVDSEPGAGTIVQVFFPVVDLDDRQETLDDSLRGTEHILFVDDEQMLIEMASMFLRRQGFRVTENTSSLEALEIFKADPDHFDIVITDQTMPEMNGSELAVNLLEIRPDIPVILFSGYSKEISEEEVMQLGIKEFLYKPFDGKTLVRAIRKVLDYS